MMVNLMEQQDASRQAMEDAERTTTPVRSFCTALAAAFGYAPLRSHAVPTANTQNGDCTV
jgi:hypothetical protein